MKSISWILSLCAAVLLCACNDNVEKELNAKPSDKPGGGNGGGNGGGGKGGGKGVTIYLTGSETDVNTGTSFGIALMGGADSYTTAETAAFQFLANKSGGGDFVVLRASGSDGYNSFIYYEIGGVNSVRTIIVDSRSKADDSTVESLVRNAEAIFIAGGDQNDYISNWQDSRLEDAINYAINTKEVPIGGSSAGLAVLGQYYYAASSGSVISSEALADPYDRYMDGLGNGFIAADYLQNVITDSHYNERDRQGRHFTFMARVVTDYSLANNTMRGVGVDEATAVLVEADGSSSVVGDGSVYFLEATGGAPETCVANTPLTWDRSAQAVEAYIVPGTSNGSNTFNFNTWSGSGGAQEFWSAVDGNFNRQ